MESPTPAPRSRPDAETPEALVLVKFVGCLHATRQVRALAARAEAAARLERFAEGRRRRAG